jgi:hypothetical protein
MKILMFFLLFLCSCKPRENNIDLELKVLENETYPKEIIQEEILQELIRIGYHKMLKVRIINKNDDIIIFANSGYHFPITYWRENNRQFNSSITSGNGNTKNGCKIFIKKNDSTSIYLTHIKEADTLFLGLFYKRDSLVSSELKFCKDKTGKMIFHSSKKMKRTLTELNQYYQMYYSKCGILPRLKENDIVQ